MFRGIPAAGSTVKIDHPHNEKQFRICLLTQYVKQNIAEMLDLDTNTTFNIIVAFDSYSTYNPVTYNHYITVIG